MHKILPTCIIVLVIAFSIHNVIHANTIAIPSDSSSYTYKIIQLSNKKYGHIIRYNQKNIIYQNSIPGCEGSNGFDTKKNCKQVANLVCTKLKSNTLPTITTDDLLSLNIKCK